ncbi:MAG: TIGR02646 family protein [Desulfosarcina sp.]|nr:TIGR02646 family protein [Desulfosarcina sp.]MBC2742861.1 TIGR02646 family protein [Desulfosarcina sp.]MBC2765771.1 TIGR02646 family protein [Desulfosarcina sp.]
MLEHWTWPGRTWGDFATTPAAYPPVKEALLKEQNGLCCYCESAISDQEGHQDSHIEHYEPQACNPGRTFDYTNMACSCNGGVDGDRHCGHKKGRKYDSALFINPSMEASDNLFFYNVEGGIGPSEEASEDQVKERVAFMINTLNLDCPKLTGMRKAHGRGVVEMINGLMEAEALDQLHEMAVFHLKPDENNQRQAFFSLSRQLFGKIGREVLAEE